MSLPFRNKQIINLVVLLLFFGISTVLYAAVCPTPTCTFTAVNSTSYPNVASGQTICVNVNYATGTITLNGGTILIQSGGTMDIGRVTFGTATTAITAASNASPIQITAASHGYTTGQSVYISGVTGNTAANGTFVITVVNANNFTLNSSTGNGAYIAGGTVGYVNTITNCGTLTSTYNLDTRKIYNNYSNNAINFSFNSGGTFNNYGAPSSITLPTWSGPGSTFNNQSGGTVSIPVGTCCIPKGTTMINNGTWTWLSNNDMSFDQGDATTYTTLTNGSGATMTTTNAGKNVDFKGYVFFNNYGTFTSGGLNIRFTVDINTAINYCRGVINFSTGSGDIVIENGSTLSQRGSITCQNFTVNNPGTVSVQDNSIIRVTSVFSNNYDNSFSFSGTAGQHGYINNTGGSSTDLSNVLTASTGVAWCGPNIANLGSATNMGASCTPTACTVGLPIELVYFTATQEAKEVKLQWLTASEINNDYFTLERSKNGLDFVIISTVKGSGNSTMDLNYFYTDHNPLSGYSYYRLKQTDYNGTFAYSNMIPIHYDSKINTFKIFPNPLIGDRVYLFASKNNIPFLSVTILDMLGNVIIKKTFKNSIEMPLTIATDGLLSNAIYMVSIFDNENISTVKLLTGY